MNFQTAQRCLKLAADVAAGTESYSLEKDSRDTVGGEGDIPMTQIPDDSSGNVLLSTQIQSKLDDLQLKDGLRKDLSQFALDTPLPAALETSISSRTAKKGNVSSNQRPSKRRKKNSTQVKSLTQYKTQNYESIKSQQRKRHVMSVLSGKKGKLKDLLDCVDSEFAPVGTSAQRRPSFSTFNAQEWSNILDLLSSRFPRCPPSQVDAVFDYLYGDEQDESHVWYGSQLPPAGSQKQSEQSGKGPGLPAAESPLALTLSQAVEENSSTLSPCDSLSRIPNTTDESDFEISIDQEAAQIFKEQMLRSPPVCPSRLASFPFAKEPLIEPLQLSMSTRAPEIGQLSIAKPHQTSTGAVGPSSTIFASPPKLAGRDQLIDLTQNSFHVVTSLLSVVKPDLQVPMTRTTTWNDNPVFPRPASTSLLFRKYENVDLTAVFASVRGVTHIRWEALESSYNDSEEEEGQEGTYDLLRANVGFAVSRSPTRADKIVSATTTRENTVFSGSTQPTDAQPPERPASLPASMPLSAKELRHSLKSIGFKPKRTRSGMLQQMESASQTFIGESHEQQRQEIYHQLTAIVEANTRLLEKVYTFEPLVFPDLLQYLIEQNPLIADLEETTIRSWADCMGICLRNPADTKSTM
ncbi:LAFA_0F15742g1_1 [Lachancea sp. 'fantastica']|nr:LAFA_0F15742g1_1 [Lachancea sp. 'fantastica']